MRKPPTDGLGRSRVGSHPGMTPKEAWEAGRGAGVFKADQVLEQNEVQIVDLEGTVLAVAKINGIVATKAVAHKLARACYHILKEQTSFDAARAFS